MTQRTSSEENQSSGNPRPTSVPVEIVSASHQAAAPQPAVEIQTNQLAPEPEPHEYLAQVLGDKPKRKRQPEQDDAGKTPESTTSHPATPASDIAAQPATPVTVGGVDDDDELITVEELGENVDDYSVPPIAELEQTQEQPIQESKSPSQPVADLIETNNTDVVQAVVASPTSSNAAVADAPSRDAASNDAPSTDRTDPSPQVNPVAVAEPAVAAVPDNPFEDMQLAPAVVAAIQSSGYQSPTPIQAETVPHLIEGRDLIGQAETGSGKTAAFAWPILSRIDLQQHAPQVIVLAPTRELAVQVATNFKKYASGMKGFRVATIYGGQSYETQFRALDRGAHVVVGTPGRVMDHLKRRTLDLSQLKTFVLDEADEMLRMGFIDDIETILEQTPRTQQTVCFSATMPPQIKRIAQRYLTDPVHVKIQSNSATAESIDQTCVFVTVREKLARLVRILETEDTDGVLVFVKTRQSTVVVSEHLIQKGIIASALNGDINQQQRERTVSQLKNGKIDIVVATDVAARGLDVQRISHVINYDFPHDTEAYVHRIGRTGRAGRSGHAVLFVEPKEKGKLSRLQRATNQRIETFQEKSLDEINRIRVDRFKDKVKGNLEHGQIDFFQKMLGELQAETELPIEQIAASLAVIAQGDQPLLLEALNSKQSNWRKDRDKKSRGDHGPMQTYRVEVGRRDNIGPGNLVGAITNEADLSNADIGRIRIHDRYSTIDLPADLPADLIAHLASVNVSGQALEISKTDRAADDDRGQRRGRGNREFGRGRSNRNSSGRSNDRGERSGGFSRQRGREDRGNRGSDSRGAEGRGGSERGRDQRGSRPERGGQREGFRDRSDNRRGNDSRSNYRGGRDSSSSRDRSGQSSYGDRRSHRNEATDDRTRVSIPGRPGKTKAAQRAKQKRRPDAKPGSPVKKYVKIRGKKK